MLSNFLIGWGVASCCAALQRPQRGEALAHQRGKKCDELRSSLWYAAWISVGSMKIFFFSRMLADGYTLLDCLLRLFMLYNISVVFLRMAFEFLPQWLDLIQHSCWNMYSSCKYDYKSGRQRNHTTHSVCMSTERTHREAPILALSTQRYVLNISA